MTPSRLIRTAAGALAALAVTAAPAVAADASATKTKTPIKHFITLMQENHSFDNYFGTYPGANGIPKDTCMPVDNEAAKSKCVKPFHLGARAVQDLSHNSFVAKLQRNGGKMDGFVNAMKQAGGHADPAVMGYYDDRDIPFYWNVADNYVLFDNFFTSSMGGSVSNHMYWVSATPGNSKGEFIPEEGFRQPTIFDRLQEAGVDWKFYIQNYDPEITYRAKALGDRGAQVVWAPILNYGRFLDDPELNKRIVDMSEYYKDLERGTLPAVAYLVPSGSSEHPPGSLKAGETFVRTLITSLQRSSAWDESAFMWTYDDWGGWHDHVNPPQVDKFGLGFRAPALLVSPYAKRGHIDGTQLDFTSMLKFIEFNWGIKPLASRDRNAKNLTSAFDFGKPPREAVFLSRERHVPVKKEPKRHVVYIAYSAALGIALLIMLVASLRRRRPARRRRRRGLLATSVLLVVVLAGLIGASSALAQESRKLAGPQERTALVTTVPPMQGVTFIDRLGRRLKTDAKGQVRVNYMTYSKSSDKVTKIREQVRMVETEVRPGVKVKFNRWYEAPNFKAALDVYYRVTPQYTDLGGRKLDSKMVTALTLKSRHGIRRTVKGDLVQWLHGTRVVPFDGQVVPKDIDYQVEKAIVDGMNVVNRGQQRFLPKTSKAPSIKLLFYSAKFVSRDLLFRFPIGKSVRLEFPNGTVQNRKFQGGATVLVPALPRGEYKVSVNGPGMSFVRPVSVSRNQEVELKMLSWLDIAFVAFVLAAIALGLLFARRRHLLSRILGAIPVVRDRISAPAPEPEPVAAEPEPEPELEPEPEPDPEPEPVAVAIVAEEELVADGPGVSFSPPLSVIRTPVLTLPTPSRVDTAIDRGLRSARRRPRLARVLGAVPAVQRRVRAEETGW